jgi:hypothetical protein
MDLNVSPVAPVRWRASNGISSQQKKQLFLQKVEGTKIRQI